MDNSFNLEVAKMRSLMERIEKPHTAYQAQLNEESLIFEGVYHQRVFNNAQDFIEMLEKLTEQYKNTHYRPFISYGYLTEADIDYPMVSRKNPLTNRMKKYKDMDAVGKMFGVNQPIGGIVTLKRKTFPFQSRQLVNNMYYRGFVPKANEIRAKFGIPPIKQKKEEDKFIHHFQSGFPVGGYQGNNEEHKGELYVPFNTYKAKVKTFYYVIDTQGKIIKELKNEEIASHLNPESLDIGGLKDLRAQNASDAVIQDYIRQIQALKMRYRVQKTSSFLFFVATIGQEHLLCPMYELMGIKLNDIKLDKDSFKELVNKLYRSALKETTEEAMVDANVSADPSINPDASQQTTIPPVGTNTDPLLSAYTRQDLSLKIAKIVDELDKQHVLTQSNYASIINMAMFYLDRLKTIDDLTDFVKDYAQGLINQNTHYRK